MDTIWWIQPVLWAFQLYQTPWPVTHHCLDIMSFLLNTNNWLDKLWNHSVDFSKSPEIFDSRHTADGAVQSLWWMKPMSEDRGVRHCSSEPAGSFGGLGLRPSLGPMSQLCPRLRRWSRSFCCWVYPVEEPDGYEIPGYRDWAKSPRWCRRRCCYRRQRRYLKNHKKETVNIIFIQLGDSQVVRFSKKRLQQ